MTQAGENAERKKVTGTKAMRTRAHVLSSALAVMERKGYAQTTIRDICKEAKVSIGTFYLYFDNKNEIFMDIYKEADNYFFDVVPDQLAQIPQASERIIEFFREYALLQVNTGIDMLKILYNPDNSWFARRRPMQMTLAKIVADAQKNGEIDAALPAEDIEGYLFNVARGCCYTWCINNGSFDLADQMDRYIKIAIAGLHSPGDATHTELK